MNGCYPGTTPHPRPRLNTTRRLYVPLVFCFETLQFQSGRVNLLSLVSRQLLHKFDESGTDISRTQPSYCRLDILGDRTSFRARHQFPPELEHSNGSARVAEWHTVLLEMLMNQ